ncbi:MAG: phosphoribosylformylglycinamidine synthase subunit PurQ [Bdellovibrio sp.]
MKTIGVVRFPGTNCDRDVFEMVEAKGFKAQYLWHLDRFDLKAFEALILPGGFSYGDYLRAGALSAKSPVMTSVREFAETGGPVLGICNGFQVLVEGGLLPGALVQNSGQRFIDDWAELELVSSHLYFGKAGLEKNLRLPIAHGEGRFYASPESLDDIEGSGQVWLRYKNTPNGSLRSIAGVMNKKKNVAGLMPHPERALYSWMGGTDGWGFL